MLIPCFRMRISTCSGSDGEPPCAELDAWSTRGNYGDIDVTRSEDAVRFKEWYESTLTTLQMACVLIGLWLFGYMQAVAERGHPIMSAFTFVTAVASCLHHYVRTRKPHANLLPTWQVALSYVLFGIALCKLRPEYLQLLTDIAELFPRQTMAVHMLIGMGVFLSPGNHWTLATKFSLGAAPLGVGHIRLLNMKPGFLFAACLYHVFQISQAASDPSGACQLLMLSCIMPFAIGGTMAWGLDCVAQACWRSLVAAFQTSQHFEDQLSQIETLRKQELGEHLSRRVRASTRPPATAAVERHTGKRVSFSAELSHLPERTRSHRSHGILDHLELRSHDKSD